MVVSGSVECLLLGMLYCDGILVDLCECLFYLISFVLVFVVLKIFIVCVGLMFYNVVCKCGELKFLLLIESIYSGELMLCFVLCL